ncbi:MAG: hydrogenase formation protein HypD [Deltaproteobacteria bacterium]|nr:hydrogenase formation protein HypD [Deltaproteobacteria bacterium]MDA8305787.1 hydrogenase formation protein HypD [Deltaproteobacteria bacterium]
MKYLDEYRDPQLAKELIERLRRRTFSKKEIRLMEICGTHTVAIFRSGLKELLPPEIRLISGPGCPVCVTANEDIDRAIWLSGKPGVIITTFGDLARVPGSSSSLHIERSRGADVRIVYATLDALRIARENPDREVIFIGIGFETTAPTIAAAVQQARKLGVENFSVFSAHKLLPPAMRALLDAREVNIDGFICPGHVSIVIGAGAYREVAENYRIPCVVTGFEPLDILQGVTLLIDQVESGRAEVENQYRRAVTWEGNVAARKLIDEIFEPADSTWRGMGVIPKSGLRFRPAWKKFDAAERFAMPDIKVREHPGCKCGEVLRGIMLPTECGLFRKGCSPQEPKGPCMVSSEGTCGAYYRYQSAPLR